MPTITIANTPLDYVDVGDGPPMLLVHGSSSDRRTWDGVLEPLSAGHRVVAYSRRYHWPNPPIAEDADYAMAEHVDDLSAVIDALELAPVDLVGHSYGAFVCLNLALQRPDCVRSLVLSEPPVVPLFTEIPPRPSRLLRLLVTRPRTAAAIIKFGAKGVGPATAALKRGDRDEALRRFAIAVLGRDTFDRLSTERLDQARANFMDAELLGSGFGPLDPEAVRRMQRPTLLLTGARSPRLFHRLADRLAQLLPNVDRREIPDASHIVHEDNPAAYTAAVLEHVRTQSQAQPQPAAIRQAAG